MTTRTNSIGFGIAVAAVCALLGFVCWLVPAHAVEIMSAAAVAAVWIAMVAL